MEGLNKYDVLVQVEADYLEEYSDPESHRFVFSYHVTVKNVGQEPARLLTRHWVITDGNQQVREVHGEGVIGDQPIILPGETYAYSSGSVLETEVGTMQGSYQMLSADGHVFDATIPVFRLARPRNLH